MIRVEGRTLTYKDLHFLQIVTWMESCLMWLGWRVVSCDLDGELSRVTWMESCLIVSYTSSSYVYRLNNFLLLLNVQWLIFHTCICENKIPILYMWRMHCSIQQLYQLFGWYLHKASKQYNNTTQSLYFLFDYHDYYVTKNI